MQMFEYYCYMPLIIKMINQEDGGNTTLPSIYDNPSNLQKADFQRHWEHTIVYQQSRSIVQDETETLPSGHQ